jgi:hypothetical protein
MVVLYICIYGFYTPIYIWLYYIYVYMVSILPYIHMVSTLMYPDVDPPTTAMWILLRA